MAILRFRILQSEGRLQAGSTFLSGTTWGHEDTVSPDHVFVPYLAARTSSLQHCTYVRSTAVLEYFAASKPKFVKG